MIRKAKVLLEMDSTLYQALSLRATKEGVTREKLAIALLHQALPAELDAFDENKPEPPPEAAVARFVGEACNVSRGCKASLAALTNSYHRWAGKQNLTKLTPTMLAEHLKRRFKYDVLQHSVLSPEVIIFYGIEPKPHR